MLVHRENSQRTMEWVDEIFHESGWEIIYRKESGNYEVYHNCKKVLSAESYEAAYEYVMNAVGEL